MSDTHATGRGVIILVAIGLTIMVAVAVRGLFFESGPDETIEIIEEPSVGTFSDSGKPGDEAPAGQRRGRRRRRRLRGDRPSVRIERRKVPGLSLKEIRASGLSMHEAMYYEKLADRKVQCKLCPALCVLADGERGGCAVRMNLDGTLRTLVYGRLVAVHDDPIEKKPLYHFIPASRAFSIATVGCNLGCVFCQNWRISQGMPEEGRHMTATPEQVVAAARKWGCDSIAYTYTEPTVFYEFMLDCARLARKEGLRNVWITCGYINPEPLRELCRVMDAANVDLKGFSEEFYREYCNASLEPVLTTLRIAKEEGLWVEITNLVIPGANDDPKMIRDMCKWIIANLGPDVPLHFSRFHPDYRLLHKPPTPPATLEMAARIAKEEGMRYVYIGNLLTQSGDDTCCPQCGALLLERRLSDVLRNNLEDGRCPNCGAEIPGVWQAAPPR